MKKIKVLSLVFCCAILLFSFTGCSLSSIGIGLSAYEVAVQNGFEGTEEEWLESLKGDYSAWESKIQDLENKLQNMIDQLENDDLNAQYATNMAMRSSVKISANGSTGTGTIINYNEETNKAHILTCFHVIVDVTRSNYASSSIQIQFYGIDGTDISYSAKFLGGNPYSDVAFLEATISDDIWEKYSLNVAKVNTDKAPNGKTCIAIGNSKNKGLNAVKGNVSKESQLTSINNITGQQGVSVIRVMRVNAILAHGNSGGGLFDAKGDLIGMINSKSSNEEEVNFSFAIPANVVMGIYANVLNTVEQNGGVIGVITKKCKIGLELAVKDISTVYDQTSMAYYPVQDVGVVSSSNSQIKLNDVIYEAVLKRGANEIKSIKVISVYDLGELMWYAKTGDTLTLKYKRDYTVDYLTLTINQTFTNTFLISDDLTIV